MDLDKMYADALATMKEARQNSAVKLQDYMSDRIDWSEYVEARQAYLEADAELADVEELLGWT